MEYTIDLHTHTTFSDGSMTPEELVGYACEKNLKAIAITDHDTIDGVKRLLESSYVPPKEIEIVQGIELSSMIQGFEIHILGYYFDLNNDMMNRKLYYLEQTRIERNLKMIRRLQELNIDISDEEMSFDDCRSISRAHMADLLVKKGYCLDYQMAFNQYLSSRGKAYAERERLSPKDSIETIHNAGGLTFLAHLNQIGCSEDELYAICQELKNIGLSGIETYYSEYDPYWSSFCSDIQQKYNFLACGGSDFHGTYKKGLDLGVGFGKLRVPYHMLQTIKKARQ
ncbi:MAG: PHP domain-containing protein [Erysipelotrichia bacterium]|nr:PHP domain-containing protein [Erysipelotrichia bacterium]